MADPQIHQGLAAAFDPDILGGQALMNLGICHVRLGELDRAEHCFGQLLTHRDLQAQARQHYALVQQLRRGSSPA
jgi:lipopolysaccharide biosynthesis regulator YciM